MGRQLFIILIAFSFSCNSRTTSKTSAPVEGFDTAPALKKTEVKKANMAIKTLVHLRDTLTINGNFILFLRPDSARFESYNEESGMYEADSDFGVAIENTLDSLSKNKNYKNIRGLTTDKRFVIVSDCMNCPLLIDRDTVNYGFILSRKGSQIKTIYNQVHSGDYLQDVNEYFGINE